MSAVPGTPKGKTSFDPKTPTIARVGSTSAVQSSPHYATTRRHSLYGVEDRVIIDAGSRIWKVGFSGEGRPRDVFYARGVNDPPLWNLSRATDPVEKAEQERLLEVKLETCLRSVFHDSLLTDPKARKVILVEHPLLPLYIKDMMARLLFENLQVPSVSFASSHLLSLLAVGRITGLVVDCGHLESVALPVNISARPLFPHLRTTPLAGARLTSHLRALLLLFGTYLPPPTSLSAAANIPAANRSMRVPQEEIKARCCFVGEALGGSHDTRDATPGDESSEMDLPPSDSTHSESDFSHAGRDTSSEFSIISHPRVPSADNPRGEGHLQALATLYQRHSTATELQMRVRTAEVLFEGGDVDESSTAEVILDALLKVPVDLRKTLASSILVVGGTSMLPDSSRVAPPQRPPDILQDRIDPLHHRMILMLPPAAPSLFRHPEQPESPPATSARAGANAGKAPAFSPATMAWVGGSLAGSLKTANRDGEGSMDVSADVDSRATQSILPDWTRSPLPAGAPPALSNPQILHQLGCGLSKRSK
ncbi:actin-domain-containing protein [Mycena sp. CBHHK59/15]|nr:actin-domain-containing protein [Mycena sp. CBHHK59/15]